MVTCNKCNKQLATQHSLQRHLAKKTPCDQNEPAAVFKCDKCPMTFRHKSKLDAHKERKKPCGKAEDTNSLLAPTQCIFCRYHFASVRGKDKHISDGSCEIFKNNKDALQYVLPLLKLYNDDTRKLKAEIQELKTLVMGTVDEPDPQPVPRPDQLVSNVDT